MRYALSAACLLAVLWFGAYLRLRGLDAVPLWVDEAESSINALTILEHGVPVDSYLGIPIFENTLVKLWPEHPEYEFRDISYSSKGLAIYHQWLPLYAMAASFRLFGVEPDRAGMAPPVPRDTSGLRNRTFAARFPSALAGVLLLAVLWLAARYIDGAGAAGVALLLGAVTPSLIWYGRQARYYSLTVTFSVLCIYALWRAVERRRALDFGLLAVSMVLLFYTHLLTFFTAAVISGIATGLVFLRDSASRWKVFASWTAVAAACTPWLVFSGFLEASVTVPSGWSFVVFPDDLWAPVKERLPYLLFLGAVFAALGWRAATTQTRLALALIAAWILVSYLSFFMLMPAASQFPARMTVGFIGPAALLVAIVAGSSIRSLGGGASTAFLVALVLLLADGRAQKALGLSIPRNFHSIEALIHSFAEAPPGARLYATPNDHLVMTFYSGLPFQSIAPVRKQFLDEYAGPIIFVYVPPYQNRPRRSPELPVLRGYAIDNWSDWWQIFCYRFVDPVSRIREKANFHDRLTGVEPVSIPGTGWEMRRSDKPL